MSIGECRKCSGGYFRYVDWTQNPTPYDPPTPKSSKKEFKQDEKKAKKERKYAEKEDKKEKKTKEKEDVKGDKKRKKPDQPSTKEEEANLPLTIEDLGLKDDSERQNGQNKEHKKKSKGKEKASKKPSDKKKRWIRSKPKSKEEQSNKLRADRRDAGLKTDKGVEKKTSNKEEEHRKEGQKEDQAEFEDVHRSAHTLPGNAQSRHNMPKETKDEKKYSKISLEGAQEGSQADAMQKDMQKPAASMQKRAQGSQKHTREGAQALPEDSKMELNGIQGDSTIKSKEPQSGARKSPEGVQRGAQGSPESTEKDVHKSPEGAQRSPQGSHESARRGAHRSPKDARRGTHGLPEGAQKDVQGGSAHRGLQGSPEGARRGVQGSQDGAQRGTRGSPRGEQRRAQGLPATHTRRPRHVHTNELPGELHERTSLEKPITKRVPGQGGDVPLKEPKEGKEDSWKPGNIDNKTKREFEADMMWYRVQTSRYIQEPRSPLMPRCWWHTRLQLKHFVQKLLNPLDTLRALRHKKDVHGPRRGGSGGGGGGGGGDVAWRARQQSAWGCGCPGLPCICHLHPTKPRKPIPRGCCRSRRAGRLMERVRVRARTEELLHEKLADLPPPNEQPPAPLFCVGLARCVGRRVLSPQLIEAAERARRGARQRAACDPRCGARCVIGYDDTVHMLRKEAAHRALKDHGKTTSAAPITDAATKVPTELRGAVTLEDMQRLIDKCAELKQGKPFKTEVICYRMEEVQRANATVGGGGVPPPASSAAQPGQSGLSLDRGLLQATLAEKLVVKSAGQKWLEGVAGRELTVARQTTSVRGDAELLQSTNEAVVSLKSCIQLPTYKNATQSTTEITSSLANKNWKIVIHRRKSRWELYKESFENIRHSMKEAAKALSPGSRTWNLNNLKYWFCSCWSKTQTNVLNAAFLDANPQEELYPYLVQLIQEEERYQNILKLKNYLVNNDFI